MAPSYPYFLAPVYPDCLGKETVKWVSVCRVLVFDVLHMTGSLGDVATAQPENSCKHRWGPWPRAYWAASWARSTRLPAIRELHHWQDGGDVCTCARWTSLVTARHHWRRHSIQVRHSVQVCHSMWAYQFVHCILVDGMETVQVTPLRRTRASFL